MNYYERADERKGTTTVNDITYVRSWKVHADSPSDDAATIAADAGMPVDIGDVHPTDVNAYCTNVDITITDSSLDLWLITASYSDQKQQLPPLSRPPLWKFSTNKQTRIVAFDKDGNPAWNSAGMPFTPGLEADESHTILSCEVNKDPGSFNMITHIQDYQDKVNNADWTITGVGTVSAHCAKISSIEGEQKEQYGTTYLAIRYVIELNADGWNPFGSEPLSGTKVLDAGTAELISGNLKAILDEHGVPISQPYPLNGAGLKLPVGDPAVYLQFRMYDETSFASIP